MSTHWFRTVADLQASPALPRDEGDQWLARNHRFTQAATAAVDHHLEVLGGAKLYVEGPVHYVSAFGCGTSDDTDAWGRVKTAIYNGLIDRLVVDVDITLPGNNGAGLIDGTQFSQHLTIEFTGGHGFVYDSDGTTPHDYFRLQNCSNVHLIRPRVRSVPEATSRNSRYGIHFDNCDDCSSEDALVEGVSGAGTFMQDCRNCFHVRPSAYRSLADGHHITNGGVGGGPSFDCWTYGAYSEDTGDDGVAVVSYDTGPAICERCGHLDFVSRGSAARGGTIVGGKNCVLRGEAYGSAAQGILVYEDVGVLSFAPSDCIVDVMAVGCGTNGNIPGIEIGRNAVRITGRLKSIDSPQRGIVLNGAGSPVSGCHFETMTEKGSGTQGMQFDTANDCIIGSIFSDEADNSALVFLNCDNIQVGSVLLKNYSAAGVAANRGIIFNNSNRITIGGGSIIDEVGNSERPIFIFSTSSEINVGDIHFSGGTAGNLLEVQPGATGITLPRLRGAATYDPPSIPAGGTVTTTVTINGARPGDAILSVQHTANTGGNLMVTAVISANNTALVTFLNPTGADVDLPSGTLSVLSQRVMR